MKLIKLLLSLAVNLFKRSPVLQRFLKVFSVDVFVKVGAFAVYFQYVDMMGSEQNVGIYGYLFSFVTAVLAPILNLGLYVAQAKLYHDFSVQQRGQLYFTLNGFLVALLAVFWAGSYIFDLDYYMMRFLISKEAYAFDYASYRLPILMGLTTTVLMIMLTGFFTASENIRLFNYHNITTFVLVNALTLGAMYYLPGDIVHTRLTYYFAGQTLVLLLFYAPYLRQYRFKFDGALLRKSINISWPTMSAAVWMMVYNFSDRWILQYTSGFENMGVYEVARKIATAILIVYASFQNIWQPFFFKEKNVAVNLRKTKRIVLHMTSIFVLISVLLWVITFGMLWFDFKLNRAEYGSVLYILPVLLLSQIILAVQSIFTNYTIYFERTYINFWFGLGGNMLNLLLNILFIPAYGIYGAVVATLISISISCSAYLFTIFKIIKNHVRKTQQDEA